MAKSVSVIDSALLEHCVREDLNNKALRRMAVIHPLKVVITNYPEDGKEYVAIENHNLIPELGERRVAFTKELYIEQEDFMENPPGKFFRLAPDGRSGLREPILLNANGRLRTSRAIYYMLNAAMIRIRSQACPEASARLRARCIG